MTEQVLPRCGVMPSHMMPRARARDHARICFKARFELCVLGAKGGGVGMARGALYPPAMRAQTSRGAGPFGVVFGGGLVSCLVYVWSCCVWWLLGGIVAQTVNKRHEQTLIKLRPNRGVCLSFFEVALMPCLCNSWRPLS